MRAPAASSRDQASTGTAAHSGSRRLKHLSIPHEIRDVVELAAEIDAFRALCNGIRPHESLDFATPLSRHLADPLGHHLSDPQSVQPT